MKMNKKNVLYSVIFILFSLLSFGSGIITSREINENNLSKILILRNSLSDARMKFSLLSIYSKGEKNETKKILLTLIQNDLLPLIDVIKFSPESREAQEICEEVNYLKTLLEESGDSTNTRARLVVTMENAIIFCSKVITSRKVVK